MTIIKPLLATKRSLYFTLVYHECLQNQASVDLAKYEKMVANNVSMYNWKDYKDDQLKRRLQKMADIGTSALKNESQLKQVRLPVYFLFSFLKWTERFW